MFSRRLFGVCLAVGLSACSAPAGPLDPSRWTVTELATGKDVTRQVADNNPDTCWRGPGGTGLLIDLGRQAVVHRVYVLAPPPAKLQVSFLVRRDGNPTGPVLDCPTFEAPQWIGARKRKEVNFKFNPARGRYVKLKGLTQAGEIEVYGSTDKAAFEPHDAVVLPARAPAVLRMAAEELRYYLGELTGRPLPIIPPARGAAYPGTLYRIEDLKPLAGTYEEMLANLKAGKLPSGGPMLDTVVSPFTMRLPDGVNVEREGRSVVFRAWPYRNVAYSVWEFLRRQGVVWSYPDMHGEYVPARKRVDLSVLPLRYRPSADRRYANFNVAAFYGIPCPDDLLFFLRNYGSDWGTLRRAMGYDREVPPLPQRRVLTAKQVRPEFAEGFQGYPHNFKQVVPMRLLEAHPDWCGMGPDGRRLPPRKGGPGTFCMTSPKVIRFVADKVLAFVGDNRQCMVCFNLLPMDGCTYCQCPRCLGMYKPLAKTALPYVPISPYSVSDAYYYFVAEVAKRVGARAPAVRIGALAYADVHAPPRKLKKLPDNVWVEVVQYGSRNLPMSSPANAAMRARQETWARKCAHLTTYEYALIHGEWAIPPMPIPLVGAIADRARFLRRMGAWNGGTQSMMKCLPHNPWNHYAYGRLMWDVRVGADQITEEFFTAYYRDAREPMLAYYRALEKHLVDNHVNLQDFAYDQGPNPEAFPPALAATLRACLADARKIATPWYVQRRIAIAAKDLDWGIAKSARRSMNPAIALANGRKSYSCRRRRGAIKIDGRLDDTAWKTARVAGDFLTPGRNQRVPDAEQTEFRMVWDDENLYVAVRCSNPQAASLKETDNVWGTDHFEWFLVPERTYVAPVYQTVVSAFNRVWGPRRKLHDQWHKDLDWRAEGLKTAVQRGDKFWTCEMALPLRALKEGPPKPKDFWRVNLCRDAGSGVKQSSSWSALLYGMWHSYRDFNLVVFEGPGGGN